MITDIVENIDARLAELTDEAQRLSAVRDALKGTTPAPRSRKPARRRTQPSATTSRVVPLGKIIKLVSSEPGLTTTTIAKRLDGDQTAILGLLREAEGEKVRREGQRRGTRWYAVDEVAKRAAEITAQDKAAKARKAEPVAA